MSVYVAMVEPGMERRALRRLKDRGIDGYAPMRREWRRAAGRRVPFERPMLPGYVFVWSADIVRDHDALRHAPHVIAVLGNGDQPRALKGEWLAWLLVAQSFGLFDATRERRRDHRVGELVRIISGAFEGYLGTVVEVRGRKARVDIRADRYVRGKISIGVDKLADPPKAA